MTDVDYLRQIELLALEVVGATDPAGLARAVGELSRRLRRDGDVDLDLDRPLLHLGGAALISPDDTDSYRQGCARLGVPERADGWALWFTWDDQARAHTVVSTALDTTRGLLSNWAQGRDVHPAQLDRARIAAVVRGWVGPVTLSPSHADAIGLGGR